MLMVILWNEDMMDKFKFFPICQRFLEIMNYFCTLNDNTGPLQDETFTSWGQNHPDHQ